MLHVDYLIIGQGIAGSVMALTLEGRGKSVAVMGRPELSASSRIAAGVYNPFNFRRTSLVWKGEEAAIIARDFYESFAKTSGRQFHSHKRIVRLLASEEERAEWETYSSSPDAKFVVQGVKTPEKHNHLLAPYGAGIVTLAGMLDTYTFLLAVRDHFSKRGYYIEEKCVHGRFSHNENSVVYDSRIEAAHVIFCEGHLATGNPFFDSRVIAPTKGELIHVTIPGFNMPAIVNGQAYLAPLGKDAYVCGATFNPGKSDEEITAAGKEELMAKLKGMTDLPFEVVGHYAGVRPAGRDRKPVIGRSRHNGNFSIFNGFGSKAVLLAPLLAQTLAYHLINGAEIRPEVNIARFKVY